nr:transmembrane 9 superfamily member 1-like [Tanacetum cinerariifolium]
IIHVNLTQENPKSLEVDKTLDMTYSIAWTETNGTLLLLTSQCSRKKEEKYVRTLSYYYHTNDEDKTNVDDNAKGDEDEEMIILPKTKVPDTSSSYSSDLAAKFLNFVDIPTTAAEIISPMDVHVHHEVPSNKTPTLLISSPIYSTITPQSTSTPPTTTEAKNPQSTLPDFALVFQFENRVTTLEKEVVELKKDDPLKTQVTALVDEHLDARLGATRDEFMNFLSTSITARITEQVKNQLPQILPKKVSNFAPLSSYEAVASLTKFELKKILIDKIDKSKSYLAALEHRECYEGLIKSYELDKTLLSTYDKVYLLKRSQKDKDKDEDPSAGLDRGLKKRKTSKDAKPTKCMKAKESQSGSSKGTRSQSKSFGKSVQSEEPEFEVADSDKPQDQEENPGNDDEEPKGKVASKCDWFTKPKRPQEATDPDWNDGKTLKQGPTQSWLMTLASSADKQSKTFDELMRTPIDISVYIINRLKINNMTQETLLGPAFKLLKGILTRVKVMRKHGYGYLKEIVVRRSDNDIYKFKEGDFPRLHINDIEEMLLLVVQNRLINLLGDDVSDFAIALRLFSGSIVIQKRVKDLQLAVESYQKKINVTKPKTTKLDIRKKDPYTPYQDPQGFIYIDTLGRNRLMHIDELYKFNDGTLTRLQTLLEDITKNIHMEYLPKRRWSTLEKK